MGSALQSRPLLVSWFVLTEGAAVPTGTCLFFFLKWWYKRTVVCILLVFGGGEGGMRGCMSCSTGGRGQEAHQVE